MRTEREKLEEATLNFARAMAHPVLYCCSGRCDDTNWGGHDRLHYRGVGCPEYSESEMIILVKKGASRINSISEKQRRESLGADQGLDSETVIC